MERQNKEHISEALIRMELTNQLLTQQRHTAIAKREEQMGRGILLRHRMQVIDERLLALQFEVDRFKHECGLL
ncbi:hypothetical protein [Spirosoma jeollabukense]